MKHLTAAIKVIHDCCTRREVVEECRYKQLLDLLPLHEQIGKNEKLENETEDETYTEEEEEQQQQQQQRRQQRQTKNSELLDVDKTEYKPCNKYNLDGHITKSKHLTKENVYSSNNKPLEKKVSDATLFNEEFVKKNSAPWYFNRFTSKNNTNIYSYVEEKKKKIESTDIYCAYGKPHIANQATKHFSLKKLEIIPRHIKKEHLMHSFSIVCMTGNQNNFSMSQNDTNETYRQGTLSSLWRKNNESVNIFYNDNNHNNNNNLKKNHKNKILSDSIGNNTHGNINGESFNDEFYFNNYEQFFIVKAYGFKIVCLLSGIGKNSITVCDNITFYLLKTILTNMKKIYNNSNFHTWTCDKIEYILLSSIADTNNVLKENSRESFYSGCALCISAYSTKYNILTNLNIGNIQTVLVKEVEEERVINETGTYTENIPYEAIVLSKNHDVLNKEEKRKIESFVPSNTSYWGGKNVCNTQKNIWQHTDDHNKTTKNKKYQGIRNLVDENRSLNQLNTLNVTKAIGLFYFTNFGLSNVPDIINVKMKKQTSGFLLLFSHSISQVYNTEQIIHFLFNNSDENNSLFNLSKKLIYNVHSIYMSTKNKNIKDMTILIMPLAD